MYKVINVLNGESVGLLFDFHKQFTFKTKQEAIRTLRKAIEAHNLRDTTSRSDEYNYDVIFSEFEIVRCSDAEKVCYFTFGKR